MIHDRIDAVMQTEFLRLRPATPIREAVAALVENRTSAAPVIEDSGSLVGILTQKDCFRSALNASYYQQWSGKVADFMSREARTLEADADFVTAAEIFLDLPFRSFPVMHRGSVVGMLNRRDLLIGFLRLG